MNNLVWTSIDFEQMAWHDSKIYSISFGPGEYQITLDIDYITRWILDKEKNEYTFEVVPAKLTFKNVYNLQIDFHSAEPTIDAVERTNPRPPVNVEYIEEKVEFDWTILTNNGEINFVSVGFFQIGIGEPRKSESQILGRE